MPVVLNDLSQFIAPLWQTIESEYKNNKNLTYTKLTESKRIEPIYKRYKREGGQGISIKKKHQILKDLKDACKVFDRNGFYRAPHQIILHNMFISACARYIYGDLYDLHETEILEENGWTSDDVFQFLSALTPRRCGKTWSVALFCIAALATIPKCEISIFSPSKPQSVMMLDKIKEFMLAKFKYLKIGVDQEQHFSLFGPLGKLDERKAHALANVVDVSFLMMKMAAVVLLFFLIFIMANAN